MAVAVLLTWLEEFDGYDIRHQSSRQVVWKNRTCVDDLRTGPVDRVDRSVNLDRLKAKGLQDTTKDVMNHNVDVNFVTMTTLWGQLGSWSTQSSEADPL